MNITIKGIPPKLHKQLKSQASRNKRSLNGEVLSILEQNCDNWDQRVKSTIAELRALNRKFKVPPLTEQFLRMAKAEGRR